MKSFINHFQFREANSTMSNNTNVAHWPLVGRLLLSVQPGRK